MGGKRPLGESDMSDPKKAKKRENFQNINQKSKAQREAGKEDRAAKMAQASDEYESMFSSISPVIAAVVDMYGGCCSHGMIAQDAELQDMLANVPQGHPKQIKKVLEKVVQRYPEYIVPLSDGLFATALAYDNGVVSPSGEVDKVKLKENYKKAEDGFWCAPRPKKVPMKHDPPQPSHGPQHGRQAGTGRRLEDCRQQLLRVCCQEDNWAFEDAVTAMREAREFAFSGRHSAQGPPPAARQPTVKCESPEATAFYEHIRQMAARCGNQPLTLQMVAKDEEAKRLHNDIPVGEKRKKLAKQLELCPEMFYVDRVGAEVRVSLKKRSTHTAKDPGFPAGGRGGFQGAHGGVHHNAGRDGGFRGKGGGWKR